MTVMPKLDFSEPPKDKNELALRDAFTRFAEASTRLQTKYEMLLRETETLRAELEERSEQVHRVERLTSLGQMAAGMAHEIRNPLGAIRLFASVLKEDLKDKPESQELAQKIEHSVVNIDHVITNMLHFSKGRDLKRSPVNLHAVLYELLECFRPMYPEVEFCDSLEGNPFILGNDSALRQVFHNLIQNSVQAMGSRGKLSILAKDCEEGAVIELQDDGPGIPEEIISRLFEPFVTSKTEGTGLGLAVVRHILEKHDAEIQAENRGGAHFSVVFKRSVPRSK